MRRVTSSMHNGQYVVTTSLMPTPAMVHSARELSERLCIPYVERGNQSLAAALQSATGALVVESTGISLRLGSSAYRYHPNMAKVRIIQLRKGARDLMADVMSLTPGDSVLDCTCGLAADAIVAAFVVGEDGRVDALEISPLLAAVASIGLAMYEDPMAELVQAMRRVRVINESYRDFLRSAQDGQYDVVYFDPMFEVTYEGSPGLEMARLIGQAGAPDQSDIAEAIRVARRRVVMRDSSHGSRLETLGFTTVSAGKRIRYGVIEV